MRRAFHAILQKLFKKKEKFNYCSSSIVLWEYFPAKDIDALQKIDGTLTKDIMKLY